MLLCKAFPFSETIHNSVLKLFALFGFRKNSDEKAK